MFRLSHWDRICKVCIKIAYSNFTSESHWQSSPHWNHICEHSICSPYWNSTHFLQEMPLVTKKIQLSNLPTKFEKFDEKSCMCVTHCDLHMSTRKIGYFHGSSIVDVAILIVYWKSICLNFSMRCNNVIFNSHDDGFQVFLTNNDIKNGIHCV